MPCLAFLTDAGRPDRPAGRGGLPIRPSSGSLTTVDRLEFVRLRAGLTANLPPASGAPLDAAAARLRRRLVASVMFTGVEVEVTEDPDRLLVALVRYRPGTPARQVSSFLEAVWISELRLPGLDVYNFLAEDGHIELESVTGDQASGYFLSLNLIALEGTADDFEGQPASDAPTSETDAPPTKKRWLRR
jgi:hypothetical protein